MNSVDGDGDQQREVAGDERKIRRPEAAEQDTHELRGFEEISKISPVGIYIPGPKFGKFSETLRPRTA